jgi:uncharacterized protein
MRLAVTAALALGFGLAAPANAASFDCSAAHSPDERAVCTSRALNDRDVTMSVLYALDRKFLAMGGRGALMDQQHAWLVRRRACGADRSCLLRLYDRRIADLRSIIDRQVVTQGPF